MFKRTLIAITLTLISLASAFAQGNEKEKKQKVYRPDIPGYFMIDLGLNFGSNLPSNFNRGLWGSRTLDLYYHYPIQIEKSNFSFNPGVGFSFQRFKFTNGYTIAQQPDGYGAYQLVNATNGGPLSGQSASVRKSMLITNYFDLIPVEFRYDTNPKDLARSFSITLGGYVGVLMEAHTKIKYSENGTTVTFKGRQNYGLNPFRYGIVTRIGIGNFNFFGMYNLSPYFATNKGPATTGVSGGTSTTMNTMTFGISLNGL